MGSWLEFTCESCGYNKIVSGGNDVGWAVATTTILCADCKELYDVVTTEEPWLAMRPGWKNPEVRCEKSDEHTVREWKAEGPCPRCGTQLVRGENFALWD